MRKPTLDLDSLNVDSFPTAEPQPATPLGSIIVYSVGYCEPTGELTCHYCYQSPTAAPEC